MTGRGYHIGSSTYQAFDATVLPEDPTLVLYKERFEKRYIDDDTCYLAFKHSTILRAGCQEASAVTGRA